VNEKTKLEPGLIRMMMYANDQCNNWRLICSCELCTMDD